MTHAEIKAELHALFQRIGDVAEAPAVSYMRTLETMADIALHAENQTVKGTWKGLDETIKAAYASGGFQIIDPYDTRTDAELNRDILREAA